MTEKTIPYVDENGDINQNAAMSEKFRYFIWDDEMSGTEDVISEINSNVAGDDIDAQVTLDADVGAKYFYACMELAKNVILSFEKEQHNNPTFEVGEYYVLFDLIYKVTEIIGNTVKIKALNPELRKLHNEQISLSYKYRKVHPATAEQIALFKRAEHFAAHGRKLDEFQDRDLVKYEGELFFAKTTSEPNLISVSGFDGYGWDDMNADEFDLIQTVEEMQEVKE